MKALLHEKLEEEEAYRAKVAVAAANRPTRGKARQQQQQPTEEQLPAEEVKGKPFLLTLKN